jgi:hypothetical protein
MMQRGNDRARQEIQSQTAMCRKACRIRRMTSWPDHFTIQQSKTILARSCEEKALTGSAFLRMPGVNRQGQAHIVFTAIVSPGSGMGVEATPWFRTWFSIDPQPASISPTINISIVFICAFLVDCGRTIRHPPIKNDSGAML